MQALRSVLKIHYCVATDKIDFMLLIREIQNKVILENHLKVKTY